MAAAAANRLRDPSRPAIVVDAGTAITVDCLSSTGVFLGGAILPGMRMAAGALDRHTDKLPLVDTSQLDAPPPIGRNTQAAISSGVYWGAVGAVERMCEEFRAVLGSAPQLYLTGGDAPRLALRFADARHVPHLVLAGIALAAQRLTEKGNGP
ncbi:MAG: type III pantothenate kinase, partial [Planctomycetales bacterium]|nr:type III pantothenate kinase [Planctomycetales bacterium]